MNIPSTKIMTLWVLIALTSLAIVVSLAVGVSVVRPTIRPTMSIESVKNDVAKESVQPQTIEGSQADREKRIQERMKQMHQEGKAQVTQDQLDLMRRMNAEKENLTPEEEAKVLERMQKMTLTQ